jgi:hypothetical protein
MAVRGVTAGVRGSSKLIRASIPGEIPSTAAGVTGVGVGDGEPVGVGVGVGVGVAVGVGVGVGVGVVPGVGVGLGLPVGRIGRFDAPVTNASSGSTTGSPAASGVYR